MPGIVDTLLFRFIGSTSHLKANIASAQKAVQGLTGSVFTAKAVMVGGLIAIGVAALVAFRKSVAAIAGLDAALREVSTLLPGTIRGLDGVRDALIDISTRTGEPPEMLTEAFYQSTSAGFTNLADSLHLTETASIAAVAGLTDSGTAIDALTTIINAYGLTAKDATEVSDKLFTTVKQGKLRFEDLAKNIGTVASTGKILGISFDTILASIASLTKNTGQVEESFTALNRAMLGIVNQTDEAREFAEALGITIDEARVKNEGWLPILQEMNEKIGGSAEAFFKLNPNIRSFKGLVVLAGEGLPDLIATLDALGTSAGTAFNAMQTINEGITRQKILISQKLDNAWKRLGTITLPIAEEAYRRIAQILTAFDSDAEKRIRWLNELGEGEAALALRRKQLIEVYEKQVEETAERSEDRLGQVLGRAGVMVRGERLASMWEIAFGDDDIGSSKAFMDAVGRARTQLEAVNFEEQGAIARRAVLQNVINQLKERSVHLAEDEAEKILRIAAGLQGVLRLVEDEELSLSTLNALLDDTVDKLTKIGGDGLDLGGDDDGELERLAKLLKTATDNVLAFKQELEDLKEFGLGLGDEVPGAVSDYLGTLNEIRDNLDEQGDAYLELTAQGSVMAEVAFSHLQTLREQLSALEDNQDAVIDAIRFTESFGDSVLTVFTSITDAQRSTLILPFVGLQRAVEALQLARHELEEIEEGTEEWAAAQAKVNRLQLVADNAFATVKVALRFVIKDTKLYLKIIEDIKKAMEGENGDEGDPFDWKKVGEAIEASARAALSLADALGVVDEKTRKVLTGFVDIGDAISKIASGNILAGAIQGLGGVVGVIGGLFGGSEPSADEVARGEATLRAEEERKEALLHNTERLAELSRNVVELAGIIGGTAGSVSLGLGRAISNAFEAVEEEINQIIEDFELESFDTAEERQAAGHARDREIERARERFGQHLVEFLEAEGLTLSDFTKAAAEAGINISHLAGIIDGSLAPTIANVTAALREAEDVAEHIASFRIGALFEGFEGELTHLRLLIELVEDEFGSLNKQLSEFQRILRETAGIDLSEIPEEWRDVVDDLLNADITTPEGRTAVEAAIEAIVKGGIGLPTEILGKLTPEQFFEFLSELEGLLDKSAEEFAEGATSFQIFRGMTEITGNRIAGLLTTDTFWNRQTALNTDQMVRLLGGTPLGPLAPELLTDPFTALTAPSLEELSRFIAAAMPPQIVVEGFEVNFTLSRSVLDEETAKEAGRIAADEFDRELGENYIVKRRSFGTRPTRVS